MKRRSDTDLISPGLVAEIQAAAAAEHRSAADIVQEALERYLVQRRKGTVLPDGVTIRDLMTHGRA